MKNKFFYLMLHVSCLLLLSACEPSARPELTQLEGPHKRGLAENPKRVLLGMRPIGEKWICFRSTDIAGDEWIIDPVKDISAVKRVRRDSEGAAISETDVYHSGRRYLNEEGDESDEVLRVECDWRTGEISMAYLGDDRALEKAIERLPPFSAQTRTAYLDLASSVAKKWEAIKATKNEQPEESMKGSGGHSKKREKKRKDARHLVVAVVALPPTFRCHESRSIP